MASFTQSRIGRRDAKTISARILTGIVRVLDFALLLIAGWLAAIGVGAWPQGPLRGLLALAATIGAGTGGIVLAAQGAYSLARFSARRSQIWPILKAVVLAASALIACLFLVNAEAPQLRAFPFAFGASALLLLGGFHLGLRALTRRWTKAARIRRRIAVVAARNSSSGCKQNQTHSKSQ